MENQAGMFSDTHMSITEYLSQLDTSEGSSHPVFLDMRKALEKMDIPVTHIVAVNRSATVVLSAATKALEPLLYLFIKNNEAYLTVDPLFNKSHKNNVRSVWIRLCEQHAVSGDYASKAMELCLLNTQMLRLYTLALASKSEIISQLAALDSPGPKYVFASTSGTLHIVYPTKSTLEKLKNAGRIPVLKQIVSKIFSELDKHGCFEEKLLGIEFIDCESAKSELYYLSRED